MQNSIFHFSLSCLDKNYDLGLKVAKKLLSILFKFSMISAQYLPMRAVFCRFYVVTCRHCESIVELNCCQLLEKKRLHRFTKLQLLNFQNFLTGKLLSSCLGFDLNLSLSPQQLGLQHVLLVFSRSKWSMKIQRGSQCIMLFKWEWCDLLLLDTKENANL